MGFKVNRKAYKLVFGEGTPLDGATVVLGGLQIGEIKQYNSILQEALAGAAGGDDSPAANMAAIETVGLQVADKLLSWDLEEEDGTPLPLGSAGVDRLEVPWLLLIAQQWGDAMSGVDQSLGKGSPSGVTSLEASIPMETNSPSLAS